MKDTVLAMWLEKSAISQEMFNTLQQANSGIPYVHKSTRFPMGTYPETTVSARGICALDLCWNQQRMRHYFLVIPNNPHEVYMGTDLAAQVDTIHNVTT